MQLIRNILILLVAFTVWVACKTTATAPIGGPSVNNDIIGSWEGCDGRVITFTKQKPLTQNNQRTHKDSIIGRYTKLGGLKTYKFTVDEIGYKLVEDSLGNYSGLVKWQNLSGKETWKVVTIHVQGDTYKDDNSDSCSKEITRIKKSK